MSWRAPRGLRSERTDSAAPPRPVEPRVVHHRISGMEPKDMPFDAKRMIYGGFEIAVDV